MKWTTNTSDAVLTAFTLLSITQAALYDNPVKISTGYAALNSSTTSNLTNWKDITVWK